MSAIGYAFGEAWTSVRRSGRSVLVSIGTIAIAFVALGGFLLLSVNLQQVIDESLRAAELSVYLREDANDQTRVALEGYLRAQPPVLDVESVSKARALERFVQDFPELADVAASLDDNPFPASLEVRLRPGTASEAQAEALAQSLIGRDGVADVRYDRRWLARLQALVTGGRLVGGVVAAVLMLGAAFTVGAVVRLSLHARRDELEIMQLVGAPFAYLRGPAVVEGALLGGAGAVLAVLALWALHAGVGRSLGASFASALALGTLEFLGARELVLMAASGVGVGALAGWLAARAIG